MEESRTCPNSACERRLLVRGTPRVFGAKKNDVLMIHVRTPGEHGGIVDRALLVDAFFCERCDHVELRVGRPA